MAADSPDRSRTPVGRRAVLVAVSVLGVGLLAGCGGEDFPDHTAYVEIDGHRRTFALDPGTCGLDDDTAFVLGRSEGGAVLQAVVGVDPETGEGVPALTGITVSDGPGDLAAFGEGAWRRREGSGDPPGTVERSGVRGSRIQLEGRAIPVDAEGRPVPSSSTRAIELDARCDEATDDGGGEG